MSYVSKLLDVWYRINAKPIVNIFFFRVFDKTGNFALLIFCAAPVPANQYILTQKEEPIYFKFSAELNKLPPSF